MQANHTRDLDGRLMFVAGALAMLVGLALSAIAGGVPL